MTLTQFLLTILASALGTGVAICAVIVGMRYMDGRQGAPHV